MNLQKILIVDDEPLNLDIFVELLEERYQVVCLKNGEQCLEQIKNISPDLLLLDVNMPGLSGLETCVKLKQDSDTSAIPVIFVSALSLPEERMAGYEAGGDDYITKPFIEEELLAKITLALNNKQKIQEFQQSSQDAMSTAMTAMSSIGEVGNVLRFFRESFAINSFDELALRVVEVCQEYGLNSAVLVRADGVIKRASSSGAIRPLEFKVLEELQNVNRIYDFGSRTAFNFTHVSFLILNMPIDDMDRYGRFKDHLALVGEGAQARVEAMIADVARLKQQERQKEVIKATSEALQLFEKEQRENKFMLTREMEEMTVKIEKVISTLGMNEEQEETIINAIKETDATVVEIFDRDNVLGHMLDGIIKMLKQ